jgi:hypothetical protein
MTDEEKRVIQSLREQGYAVVVYYPSEVAGIDRSILEDRMVDKGNEIIDDLKGRDSIDYENDWDDDDEDDDWDDDDED